MITYKRSTFSACLQGVAVLATVMSANLPASESNFPPLVRKSAEYAIPAFWNLKPLGGRDFWYRGHSIFAPLVVDRKTWTIVPADPKLWFYTPGAAADTYGISEAKYENPFGRYGWGALFTLKPPEREKAFALFKQLIGEEFIPRKIPFWIMGELYEAEKNIWRNVSEQEYRRYLQEIDKMSQGLFLGVVTDEWDGTWLKPGPSGRVGPPADMAKDVGNRRDFWRFVNDRLLPKMRRLDAAVADAPWSQLSGSFPLMNYWCYEMGSRFCMMEVTCGPFGMAELPFMRGAGRQYEKPWGWWRGCKLEGWPHYMKLESSISYKSLRWLRPDRSLSQQHILLHRLVPFMAGANLVIEEGSPRQFFADYDEDGTFSLNNPRGEDLYRFYQFTQRHADRGVPYTPVGVLMDWSSGWSRPWGLKWGVYPYEESGQMENAFWNVVLPNESIDPLRDETYQIPSPYGDVFDVLLPNPPSGPMGQEKLNTYRVLILLGDVQIDAKLAERLRKYVESGGTLVMNVMQLSDGLDDKAFTGLDISQETATAEQCRGLPDGKATEGGEFTYRVAQLAGAEVVMEEPATHRPLVTRYRHGSGQLIVTLCEWMVEKEGKRVRMQGTEGDYQLRKKAVCFWPHLMELLTAELLPVHITGERRTEQLWYMVSKKENGWLVTLVNQGGFRKPLDGDPEYHPENKLDLRLTFEGKPLAVQQWTAYGDTPLDFKAEGESASVQVTVAPGELKVIELKTSNAPDRIPSRLPTNLALGKKATASTTIVPAPAHFERDIAKLPKFEPEQGVDGKSDYLNGWFSAPGFPQWYEVDLGAEQSIGRIVLKTFYPRDPYWQLFYRYFIEVSPDHAAWERVADATKNLDLAPEIGTMHWVGGKKVRYVRVTFTASSVRPEASVRELEVYPYDATF